MSASESELSDSDVELQEAFVEGRLKPGLNIVAPTPKKQFANHVAGLKQKLSEFKLNLPWIETLDCVNKQAPLAPELAAQMHIQEEKRENQLRNNKKLPQFTPSEDPVLNDFKRETMFYRQAQATVLEALPRVKALGLATLRPEDYFAEMAKSDEHMQKIRTVLIRKQTQQQRSEKVKQLRQQRKEGKMLQIQNKLERQKEKKIMLDQVKKVKKGKSQDFSFLEDGKRKISEKRRTKDRKFGFGGKKKGSKLNTKDSAGDISEYRRPKKPLVKTKGKAAMKRPGKNRRMKSKARGKR